MVRGAPRRRWHTELEAHVTDSWKEAVQYGTLTDGPRLDRDLMFEDVFKEMPEHLRKQREQLTRAASREC